jgi:7-cyano-7-deazaguanine synthase in queuosine biosynthesis
MNTLINLSGGLDSVYCAWRLLKENPEEKFLIHHVARDKMIRTKKEKEAVASVLSYLKNSGITNFKYIETQGYVLPKGVSSIKGIEMVGFFTGVILRTYKNIKNVVICANAEDLVQGEGYDLRSKTRFNITDATSRGVEINYLYPIKHMTKGEIADSLPVELLSLCFYCRTPDSKGNPCENCQPCRNIRKNRQ